MQVYIHARLLLKSPIGALWVKNSESRKEAFDKCVSLNKRRGMTLVSTPYVMTSLSVSYVLAVAAGFRSVNGG